MACSARLADDSASIWENACFTAIDAFIEALRGYPLALVVKNLYFAARDLQGPGSHTAQSAAARSPRRNFLRTRTLVIDGDVKPGAFATTAECKQTISRCLRRSASSRPSSSSPVRRSIRHGLRDIGHARLSDYDARAVF